MAIAPIQPVFNLALFSKARKRLSFTSAPGALSSTIWAALFGAFSFIVAPLSAVAETYEIDQVIDLTALTPEEVYRFEPDYLWIEPGDALRILNSTGNHTVTSIEGMWPAGVDLVDIEHKPVAEVILTEPGVYGFRCKVHGRHGMYALVIVGSPNPNIDDIEYTNIGEVGRRIFARLFERMHDDMSSHSQ